MKIVSYIVSRVISVILSMVLATLLAFLATIYLADPKMAADFGKSCVSCKRPATILAGPRLSPKGDSLTMRDLKVILSPITIKPKTNPEPKPTEQQKTALDRVNYYRDLVGVKPISLNKSINKASRAHASYDANHNLAGHVEVKGDQGYSGIWPWDRMKHFDYCKFTYATEVCSTRWASTDFLLSIDPKWAVDSWVDTVYHRLPIISPNVYEGGFGSGKVKNRVSYVMDFANPGFADKQQVVFYPVDGQDNVPTEFAGDETPDPLPGKTYPVGYPITVTFNGYNSIKLERIELTDDNGVKLDFYKILPFSDKYIGESLAIIPVHPLANSTVYYVHLSAELDDKPIYLDWQFETRPPVPKCNP